MQISVFEGEPGYDAFQLGLVGFDEETETIGTPKHCFVYLDGVEQPLVQRANEEEGWVDRNILTDPDDPLSYKLNEDESEWVLERVHGKVVIEFRDPLQ